MVDALGGVDGVHGAEPIDDRESGLTLTAGTHTLQGEQALAYVRTRKSLGDGSDLGRIKRQQAFLSSVAQEATSSRLLFQPTKLFGFLDAATKSLTTDPDFGLGTMKDLAESVRGIGLVEHPVRHRPQRDLRPRPQPGPVAGLRGGHLDLVPRGPQIGEEAEPSATPSPTRAR